MTNTNEDDDSLATDAEIAEQLSKHPKSLKRWDSDPRLKALGWPDRIYINNRIHRSRGGVREFVKNAAAAHISARPFKTT